MPYKKEPWFIHTQTNNRNSLRLKLIELSQQGYTIDLKEEGNTATLSLRIPNSEPFSPARITGKVHSFPCLMESH